VPLVGFSRRAAILAAAAVLATLCAGLLWLPSSRAATSAAVASATVAASPPAPITLDAGWQLLPAAQRGTATPAELADGNALGWTAATVPGVFNPDPLPQFFKGSVTWYRLQFTGPTVPAGFTWALHFESVRRTAQVWLNGKLVGDHSDPYSPFLVPTIGLLPGQLNTLVVRVSNVKGVEPREGWWNWGGITGPVTLVPRGPVVVDEPGLLPELNCTAPGKCTAAVRFDGWVSNHTAAPVAPTIAVTLTAPGGGPVTHAQTTAAPLAPGTTRRVDFQFPVAGSPKLWAPGQPNLYAAQILTHTGGATGPIAQDDQMNIGLRTVTVKKGQLYVNDRPVELSGASIEEDVPGRGPALTGADMNQMISQLKALHANVTRAQYGLSPLLLDKLDAAGILVWSQAPIYHRDELLVTPAERAAAMATLRSTVLESRNHPSILTHSVANELSPVPDRVAGTRDYLTAAAALTTNLDNSVPVSLDVLSYPGYPYQKTYKLFPLLGINNYFGWYPGRGPHSTASINSLAPFLRTMHTRYPTQSLVMTEFGSEATIPGPVKVLHSFAYQQQYISHTLSIARSLPFMDGAIYWTLREFAVKPHWIGGPGGPGLLNDSIHHKGLITYYGDKPKPAFTTVAAEFAATPLYRTTAAVTAATAPVQPGLMHASSAWTTVLAVLGIVLLVAILLGVQIWAFAGIRATRRQKYVPGRSVPWQKEAERERVSV
jgi:hypothetical protein